jgi:hypothetical protein
MVFLTGDVKTAMDGIHVKEFLVYPACSGISLVGEVAVFYLNYCPVGMEQGPLRRFCFGDSDKAGLLLV